MDRTDDFGREFSPQAAATDLMHLVHECDQRCLYEASRWASEQLIYMDENITDGLDFDKLKKPLAELNVQKRITLDFARKLIQNCEYYRARQFLQKTKRETPVENFLYFFSWYMICQRKRAEKEIEDLEKKENQNDEQFFELCKEIERLYRKNPENFDSYLLYLLALIKHDGQQSKEAKKLAVIAIEMDVRCWPAWDLLAKLCTSADFTDIEQKPAYRTWQYLLFAAEAAERLQLLTMAKDFFTEVSETIFSNHPYILCSIATTKISLQENQSALEFFGRVRKLDPYRIDQMNLYSNALFIRDEELKLTELADFFDTSHRFTWENCIILANYYSIRKMHEKAIEFLRRAIRLRPEDSQTFILLGQELLQTKDHQAATLAYRQAIALDPKSFRAWYCLGQLYEILKLPAFALYYYQQAVRYKPTDSRMLIATGVMLVKLRRYDDAEKCFKKAFQIGDVEGNALTELGSLYEHMKRFDQAARAYEYFLKLYCDETKDVAYGDEDTIASVCKFLSGYYFNRVDYQKAYEYAQRCLHFDKTKEHAAQMLRNIKIERAKDIQTPVIDQNTADMSLILEPGMNSFVHQSTPAGGAHTSRAHPFSDPIPLEQSINHTNQQADVNVDEVSMEDADDSEQVSF